MTGIDLRFVEGVVMEINNKKKHLFHIKVSFITFLFAMCLTINAFFFSSYNFYELVDKTIAIETCTVSESIVSDGEGDNTTYYKTSFLSKNNSYYETITKNTCPIFMVEVILKGINLLLFLIVIFLFDLIILLPDKWTLIKQKVRLDN